MKKIFLMIVLVLSVLANTCFAFEPVITSDTRTFNPLTGVYELTGNVHVELQSHDQPIIIKGGHAKVNIYAMEVHADKNISLTFGELNFLTDQVDVYHKDRTAYVIGNCKFHDKRINVTSDKGSYCWRTKLAIFSGNVRLDGAAVPGDLQYNVLTGEIVK
ncbi:MAG: OstA-like protein [Phascolarctobacterium sp.]|nr:OstA-like protein [Phascolarctobacterium sp.]